MTTDDRASFFDNRVLWRSLGLGLFLGLVWAAAAAWRPESTYHLAPPLMAALVPFLYASEAVSVDPRWKLWIVADFGLILALAEAFLLDATGLLGGPSLLPTGGALFESIVFALGGAIVGLLLGLMRLRSS